jgi:very-short-patch-repair endonuclease
VIEADGGSHTDPERDCARDAWFIERGWFVLRFSDDEITDTIDNVLDVIYMALDNPAFAVELLNEKKPHRWCLVTDCPL